MFAALKDTLAKAFRRPSKMSSSDKDIVYFGGFEESELGSNEVLFALYFPSDHGLIYLPYSVYEEKALEQLRAMEVGEAFYVLEEDQGWDIGGTITKIGRIIPPQIIRIEGRPTNHPEALLHPVMKLFS